MMRSKGNGGGERGRGGGEGGGAFEPAGADTLGPVRGRALGWAAGLLGRTRERTDDEAEAGAASAHAHAESPRGRRALPRACLLGRSRGPQGGARQETGVLEMCSVRLLRISVQMPAACGLRAVRRAPWCGARCLAWAGLYAAGSRGRWGALRIRKNSGPLRAAGSSRHAAEPKSWRASYFDVCLSGVRKAA